MREEIAQLLLGSIDADRLAIFTGAGLSMALPSTVPSAARLAFDIAQKYETYGALLATIYSKQPQRPSSQQAGRLETFQIQLEHWG